MPIFLIWLAYRILTSAWAAILSSQHPVTLLEKSYTIWPPAPGLSIWLERDFLAPWLRWDAVWYLKIVTSGYAAADGTAQFHPLYAWLSMPLAWIGIHPLFSLLLVSSLAGLGFLYVFELLTRLDLDPKTTRIATVLLVGFPTAFILFAPYTESLFLLCSAASLLFMRKNKVWLAGLMGALAALTRQQGIFLIFPLAWEVWENAGRDIKTSLKAWPVWLSTLGPVAGLAAWFVYRASFLNDFTIKTQDINSYIYSGLISSSAAKVVPFFQFTWPWKALWLALHQFKLTDVDLMIDLILGGVFIVLLALSWKNMRVSYRIYSAIIALVSFGYYTGPLHPYMGLPRHLFLAFPVFIGIAPALGKQRRWLIYLAFGLLGMLFLIAGYIYNGWVP